MGKNILLVPPPFTPVSKDSVAGIEQVTYTLGKFLHEAGHNVYTVAREDSEVYGTLLPSGFAEFPSVENAEFENFHQAMAYHQHVVRKALRDHAIDVIIGRCFGDALLTSIEEDGPRVIAGLDMEPKYFLHEKVFEALKPKLKERNDCFAAVADHIAQRYIQSHLGPEFADGMNTIYNGIITDNFPMKEQKGDYLLYLGRIVKGKAPHLAISAANETGHDIIVAGGSAAGNNEGQYADDTYFNEQIKPLLGSNVTWFGPANLKQKVKLMQNAKAVIFPSQHVEAQPLVILEAMACGTPVIAYDHSGAKEEIIDGKTGFLVKDDAELQEAIKKVGDLSPKEIAEYARANFDYKVMGRKYLDLIEGGK